MSTNHLLPHPEPALDELRAGLRTYSATVFADFYQTCVDLGLMRNNVDVKTFTEAMRKRIAGMGLSQTEAVISAHKINGVSTYADLIRMLGMNNKLMLAMTIASPSQALIVDRICASRKDYGSWTDWCGPNHITTYSLRKLIEDEHAWRANNQPSTAPALANQPVAVPVSQVAAAVVGVPHVPPFPTGGEAVIDATPAQYKPDAQEVTPVDQNAQLSVSPQIKPILDSVLAQSGMGLTVDQIIAKITDLHRISMELIDARRNEVDLRSELAKAKNAVHQTVAPVQASGPLPAGKCKWVQVGTIFKSLKDYDFEVPCWEWEAQHPDVPVADPNYIFRKDILIRLLMALATGEMAWVHGHTGTGKTTLIEQVAARLNWPVARVAFDSAIDRAELVGRMELKADGKGGTISEWKPGVLEYALPNGYILLCDEFDHARPDALYTIQPTLERKPLRLLEDGGRLVPFHAISRLIATANTAGCGDVSNGLYPTARQPSAATMDRFTQFIEVPYMKPAEEKKLIKAKTGLAEDVVNKLVKFAAEMRNAFTRGEIPVSYSPRRSLAYAKKVDMLLAATAKSAKPMSVEDACGIALSSTLLAAAPVDYQQRITEVAKNVFGAVNVVVDESEVE